MLDIQFLGTSAGLPTKKRAPSCVGVRYGNSVFLFDCGEGSQRQLMLSNFSFMKIAGIFITHTHGDHVYGLIGLLETMAFNGRTKPLVIRGPEGFTEWMNGMIAVCRSELNFPIDIADMIPGEELSLGGCTVMSVGTEHDIPSLGYRLTVEQSRIKFDADKLVQLKLSSEEIRTLSNGGTVKGLTMDDVAASYDMPISVVYSGDTLPCDGIREASRNATLLIHEATFLDREAGSALEHNHTTAKQAATIAKECGCRHLIMTHVSQRYDDDKPLVEEAKAIFPEAYVAGDMDMFQLTKQSMRFIAPEKDRTS